MVAARVDVAVFFLLILCWDCSEAKKAVACENSPNDSAELSCYRPGTVIDIVSVNYGRLQNVNTRCSINKPDVSECLSSSSIEIVKDLCQGEVACSVQAANSVFGDPCIGVSKYLFVEYKCRRNVKKRAVACERDTLVFGCDRPGTVINIISANYGRVDGATTECALNLPGVTECTATDSLNIVKSRCQGYNSCSLKASNVVFGGDPCSGVSKYLLVEYNCQRIRKEREVACEQSSLTLTCDRPGTVINIISANYGRVDGVTTECALNLPGVTECTATDSLNIVKSRCQGQSSCIVQAANSVFGDPCGGIVKYLTVEYRCRKLQTENRLACERGNVELSCDQSDNVINVISANYGRRPNLYASCNLNRPDVFECTSSNSLGIVKELCEGYSSCSVQAANSVFGDPCRGVVKYLAVEFRCRKIRKQRAIACEHAKDDSVNLQCPSGFHIDVLSANYGRVKRVNSGCNNLNRPDVVKCRSSNSKQIVTDECQGKNSCSVQASNRVFGDPCKGVVKYLIARYRCIRP